MNEIPRNELKPCPFCGCDPKLTYEGKNGIRIKCTGCGMGIKQKVLERSLDWLEGVIVKAWNNRVSP
jgi:hypothetical protein